jgi:hypothetical protein
MKQQTIKRMQRTAVLEHGVNLDVLGRALIAQADERIKWHRHMATLMAEELKAITPGAAPGTIDELKQRSRRTDLESKISGHLEYARFLTFVRQNIVRTRRYRLGLTDMSLLEITPKGSYC